MAKRFSIALMVCLVMVILVVPVLAGNLQNIPPGKNVFIGEKGLNLTGVRPGTTLSWYTGYQTVGRSLPAAQLTVGNPADFSVAPADFVGHTGNWYIGNTRTVGIVVNDPKQAVFVYDQQSGRDVTGKSVPAGDFLVFRMDTNLNVIPSERQTTEGFMTIWVRAPDGTLYTSLWQDKTTVQSLLNQAPDATPYYWNDIPLVRTSQNGWDTGFAMPGGGRIYQAGSYTVWTESDLNGLKGNYKDASGKDYTGKTVSAACTVTIAPSPVPTTRPTTVPTTVIQVLSPKPDFTASVREGRAPLPVQFTDKSTNSPAAWYWTFGDGSSSTQQNPAHTYLKAGSYPVKLTVSNRAGNNALSRPGYIIVSNAPTLTPTPTPSPVPTTRPTTVPTTGNLVISPKPDFTASVREGRVPLPVQFTDKSTNSPAAWYWTFGDGSSSTQQNPAHTYLKAGSYLVKLTVSNRAGTNSLSRPGYITVSNVPAPTPTPTPVPSPTIFQPSFGVIAHGHLDVLAETIGPRPVGQDGEKRASEYIRSAFEKAGYTVQVQPFRVTTWDDETVTSQNIIAVKPGTSSDEIIIGAHYDSAGPGEGADDNAASVAILLELAEQLKDKKTPYTVRFIAFGSEEVDLDGSHYFVRQMGAQERKQIIGMINLDSLAAGDYLYLYGDKGVVVRDLVVASAKTGGIPIETMTSRELDDPDGTPCDCADYSPFQEAGIPFAFLEATNWDLGEEDGLTQFSTSLGRHGVSRHNKYDTLDYLNSVFPGRIDHRLTILTKLFTDAMTT